VFQPTSDNSKSRLAALTMLGYIAESATNAVPALTLSLKDTDTAVQVLAAQVLAVVNKGKSADLSRSVGSRTAQGASGGYYPSTGAGASRISRFTNSGPY